MQALYVLSRGHLLKMTPAPTGYSNEPPRDQPSVCWEQEARWRWG